jgi:hypothetical protein
MQEQDWKRWLERQHELNPQPDFPARLRPIVMSQLTANGRARNDKPGARPGLYGVGGR